MAGRNHSEGRCYRTRSAGTGAGGSTTPRPALDFQPSIGARLLTVGTTPVRAAGGTGVPSASTSSSGGTGAVSKMVLSIAAKWPAERIEPARAVEPHAPQDASVAVGPHSSYGLAHIAHPDTAINPNAQQPNGRLRTIGSTPGERHSTDCHATPEKMRDVAGRDGILGRSVFPTRNVFSRNAKGWPSDVQKASLSFVDYQVEANRASFDVLLPARFSTSPGVSGSHVGNRHVTARA